MMKSALGAGIFALAIAGSASAQQPPSLQLPASPSPQRPMSAEEAAVAGVLRRPDGAADRADDRRPKPCVADANSLDGRGRTSSGEGCTPVDPRREDGWGAKPSEDRAPAPGPGNPAPPI